MKDTAFSVPEVKLGRLATCYQFGTGRLAVYDKASGGRYGKERMLSRPTVELMTSDQLTPAQKAASPFFPGFWDSHGWGFGLSVITRRDGVGRSSGSFGWDGGFHTSCYVDPHENMVAILLAQRLMTSPIPSDFYVDFWTLAYQAIDD